VRERSYLLGGVLAILASYLVPYMLLRDARGLELFAYWSLLVVAWIILTAVYLRRVE